MSERLTEEEQQILSTWLEKGYGIGMKDIVRKILAENAALRARAEEAEEWLPIERSERKQYASILEELVMLPLAAEHYGELPERVHEVLDERDALRTALLKIADYALAGTIEDAPWLQAIARHALARRGGGM